MAIDSHGGVSIFELIVYIPATVLSVIVCSRHGFKRSEGWIYILILCIVRIIGAICQLVTYSHNSEGLVRATAIIDSIGLSPLLLATLGMLFRLVNWVIAQGRSMFNNLAFRAISIIIIVGLILSIVGGTSGSTTPSGTLKPATTTKAGIILFFAAFIAILFILVISSASLGIVPSLERRIAVVLGVASPFIFIRLLYSLLCIFLHNKSFSVVNGSIGARIGMSVLEEMIVVVMYLFVGFTLNKLDGQQDGPSKRSRTGHGREPIRDGFDLQGNSSSSRDNAV